MTVTTKSIHYAVQIDISPTTVSGDADATIGLYSDALLDGGSGGCAFRWITDRPGYPATTPTGEIPTANATTWRENILLDRSGLGQIVRMINLLVSGGYGSLSGFDFKIDNVISSDGTGDSFIDLITAGGFYFNSANINFFIVIDDVFYKSWGGIVTGTDYNEMEFNFKCEDSSKTVHKAFPPNSVSINSYPDLNPKDEGKVIPVCMGWVKHAKLVSISSIGDNIDVLSLNSVYYKNAPINTYTASTSTAQAKVGIITGNNFFQVNELAGYYIRHIIDGDGQVVKIVSNTITSGSAPNYITTLTIDKALVTTPVLYTTVAAAIKCSWVEIFKFDSVSIVSEEDIYNFRAGEFGNRVVVKYWDNTAAQWIDVSGVVEYSNTQNIKNTLRPGVSLSSKNVDYDGNFSSLTTHDLDSIKYIQSAKGAGDAAFFAWTEDSAMTADIDLPLLSDRDSSTYKSVVGHMTNADGPQPAHVYLRFLVGLPQNLPISDYDGVYILADFRTSLRDGYSLASTYIMGSYERVTPLDLLDAVKSAVIVPDTALMLSKTVGSGTNPYLQCDLIPGSHYNTLSGNTLAFGKNSSVLDLKAFYTKSKIFDTFATARVELQTKFTKFPSGQTNIQFDVYQMCLALVKNINVVDEDLYIKLDGEYTGGSSQTNTIYLAFKHILEDYDGLTNVDYGNLSIYLNGISSSVGRQITDRKSSKEYLTELARQSVVGIYPTREGYRGLKAFREDRDIGATHSTANGSIIADSITRFEKSDINQVYNDFEIRYDYNPAADKYDKIVYVHNADQEAFPGYRESTGTDTPITTLTSGTVYVNSSGKAAALLTFSAITAVVGDYISLTDSTAGHSFDFGKVFRVSGTTILGVSFSNISGWSDDTALTTGTTTIIHHTSGVPAWTEYVGGPLSHTEASDVWDFCRAAYLKTGKINPIPESIGNCKWFPKNTDFDPDAEEKSDSGFALLVKLVEWTTQHKDLVEYSIPITAANVVLELMDPITFVDQKYTNGADRKGYISKIKIVPSKDLMIIELTIATNW